MIRMVIKIFSIVLLFFSCNNKNQSQTKEIKEIFTDSLSVFSNQWKQDSLGCKKIRTLVMFEKLMNGYSFKDKNKASIYPILGFPNAEEKFENISVVIYYYNTICEKEKLVNESDKSSIRLIFDMEGKLKKYDTRIE